MSAIVRPGYGQRLWIGRDGTFPIDPYVEIGSFVDGTAAPVGLYQNLAAGSGFIPPNAIGWNPIRQQCWMGLNDGTVLAYPDVWLCGEPVVIRDPTDMPATFVFAFVGAVVGPGLVGSTPNGDRELFVIVEQHTTGFKIVAVNMDTGSQVVWANLPSSIAQVIDIVPFAQQASGIVHPRGVIITGVIGEGDEQQDFLASVYSTGLYMWKVWPRKTEIDENTNTYIRISGAWSTQSGALVCFGRETLTNTSYTDEGTGRFYDITTGVFDICHMVIPVFSGGASEISTYSGTVPVNVVEDNEFSFIQTPVGGIKRVWGGQTGKTWLRGGAGAPAPVGLDMSGKIGLFDFIGTGPLRQIWKPDPDQNFGNGSLRQSYFGGAVPGPGAMEWTEM